MSDREREILGTVAEAIPKLTDFEKGYILGLADNAVSGILGKNKEAEKEDKKEGE